ncbi:MAG: STAS domain-containing protein [Gemmatimonadetes bacterium]|jgi:anti-sigma B factor antagonist|nr:STAS domain-containing protein [Gemmatimonadota bacterium]MBT7913086.1 STAS domain-containing protein [Candidatus Bathyarchaeota archaeon]
MEDRIKTAVENVDGTAVIKIEGDLTAAAQEQLDADYATAIVSGASRIVIAFRETDHINSAGVGILIGLVMECRNKDIGMRFAHPSPHFRRIFDIVGLSRYVEIFPTLEKALVDFTH